MRNAIREILHDPNVRAALWQAWIDSRPGPSGGIEQGGFIVRDESDRIDVCRWPPGTQIDIRVPVHRGCEYDGRKIVASFHTHPNTGPEFEQEPSESDMWSVCDDLDLKGDWFIGEFVIADRMVYLVSPDGSFDAIGVTASILTHPEEER